MSHVVADISKNASTIRGRRRIPIPVYHVLRKMPERDRQHEEKCRWHDEPVLVHGQVVVDAVEEEVQSYEDPVVREVVVDVEEATMHPVFDYCPKAETEDPVGWKCERVEVLA